jgi:hypothetical protein
MAAAQKHSALQAFRWAALRPRSQELQLALAPDLEVPQQVQTFQVL